MRLVKTFSNFAGRHFIYKCEDNRFGASVVIDDDNNMELAIIKNIVIDEDAKLNFDLAQKSFALYFCFLFV